MEFFRKYNYPTSTRALFNGKRHYQVNNERLPSVTSILSATMTLEKREEAGSRDILAIAPENAKDRLADLQQVKNDTLAH